MSASMHLNNDELKKYLLRYCTRELAPHFAVMLRGTWGSGKTWFIDRLRASLEEVHGKKVIYVSLYSVARTSDITDQFFQQLHPLLASGKVQKPWALLKTLVKGTLRVDLTGDGDKDNLQLGIPDFQQSADPRKAILVFDDLERCAMPPSELLGYLNQFVEHDEYRVIVLAHEQQIDDPGYHQTKEKVIGRTFEIQPDAGAALTSFIAELSADDAIGILRTRKQQILAVMDAAGHKNLRHLRQAVLDFSDIWSCLSGQDPALNSHDGFLDRLVHEVFAFSIELRAKTIAARDIYQLARTESKRTSANHGIPRALAEPAEADTRFKLHDLAYTRKLALPPDTYAKFFASGYLSDADALEGLRASAFFMTEKAPAWRRLLHKHLLNDTDFDDLKAEVYAQLAAGRFPGKPELFHSAGVLLQLSQEGLLEYGAPHLLALAKAAVDKLFAQRLPETELAPAGYLQPIGEEMAFGMQYAAVASAEFRELAVYFNDAKAAAREAELARLARNWLAELRTDAVLWAERIRSGGGDRAHFAFQPIFTQLVAADFAALLLAAQTPKLHIIADALKSRYDYIKHDDWKLEELPFWTRVSPLLHEHVAAKPAASLSAHTLRTRILPDIDHFIANMQAISALPASAGQAGEPCEPRD
jgi:hypothetical protein